MGDDLCEREGGGFHIVAALDDFEVRRYGAEVFVRVLVGKVAEAEGLADFAGGEEFFKLYGLATWLSLMLWAELQSETSARTGMATWRRSRVYLGWDVEGAVRDV